MLLQGGHSERIVPRAVVCRAAHMREEVKATSRVQQLVVLPIRGRPISGAYSLGVDALLAMP
eukprot:14723603-Alexandrium_andersonii.AAC.1